MHYPTHHPLPTLLDEGSVVPVRSNAPGRGRPTQLLTLNASAAHAVGLLVTRTSCAAVMREWRRMPIRALRTSRQ